MASGWECRRAGLSLQTDKEIAAACEMRVERRVGVAVGCSMTRSRLSMKQAALCSIAGRLGALIGSSPCSRWSLSISESPATIHEQIKL